MMPIIGRWTISPPKPEAFSCRRFGARTRSPRWPCGRTYTAVASGIVFMIAACRESPTWCSGRGGWLSSSMGASGMDTRDALRLGFPRPEKGFGGQRSRPIFVGTADQYADSALWAGVLWLSGSVGSTKRDWSGSMSKSREGGDRTTPPYLSHSARRDVSTVHRRNAPCRSTRCPPRNSWSYTTESPTSRRIPVVRHPERVRRGDQADHGRQEHRPSLVREAEGPKGDHDARKAESAETTAATEKQPMSRSSARSHRLCPRPWCNRSHRWPSGLGLGCRPDPT
jgi:hypothetical protein